MSLLRRLLGGNTPRDALGPLYRAIVAGGRDPTWYRKGGVADSLDGRFDLIAAILALVLMRLERDGAAGCADAALLTELFVADMDGQLRELGVGDVGIGKQVGRMMGALGGRLAAYGAALERGGSLEDALVRNLYRGRPPAPDEMEFAAARLRAFASRLRDMSREELIAGELISE